MAGAFEQRSCRAVQPGFYSGNGDNERYPCDNGTFAATPRSSKCSLCTNCAAGKHEDTPCTPSTDRTCQDVDAGNYSAAGDNAQRPCFNAECPEGTFRTGSCDAATGAGFKCEVCDDCAAGEYENTTCSAVAGAFEQRSCRAVEPGFYSPRGQNTRTPCGAGTFADTPADKCSACPQGYFQDSLNATSCKACSPGHWCSSEAQYACSADLYNPLAFSTSIKDWCDKLVNPRQHQNRSLH